MKKYWYHRKSLKALLGMLGIMVAAAGPGRSGDLYLESVVTPARRAVAQKKLPINTGVVTKEQIRKKNAMTLDQALEGTLGVTGVERTGTIGSLAPVTLRGFRPKHTLLMVDGVRIVDGGGEANMPNFPLDNVERVEVLRGPGSALYGANAMAGGFNLITKEPEDGPATTDISASFGSFMTQKYQVEFGAKPGRLGAYVTGGKTKSEGFRINSGYDADYYTGKFNYDATPRDRITLSGQFFKSSVGTPGPSLIPVAGFNNNQELAAFTTQSHQEDERRLGVAAYRRLLGDATTVQVKVYGTRLSRLFDSPETIPSAFKKPSRSEGISDTVGGEVQADHPVMDDVVVTVGGEFRREGYRNTNLLTGKTEPDVTRDVTGGYLQALGTFGNLSVLPGVRVDRDQAFGTETNPRLGASYRITERVRVTGNVGRAFRAPSFVDLFYPGYGNPDLKAERAWTYEVGAEAKPVEAVVARVTAHRTDVTDQIYFVTTDTATSVGGPRNVAEAFSQGVEVQVAHRLGRGVSHGLQYNWLEAQNHLVRVDPFFNTSVIPRFVRSRYAPEHSGAWWVDYEAGFGLGARLTGRFVSSQWDWNDNGSELYAGAKPNWLPGYGVWNLRLAQKILDLEVFAQVDNLLDRRYLTSTYGPASTRAYPLPGRTYAGGLRIRFWG